MGCSWVNGVSDSAVYFFEFLVWTIVGSVCSLPQLRLGVVPNINSLNAHSVQPPPVGWRVSAALPV